MIAENKPTSIFSQKLDRIVYTAYLLGAVVPLVALAFIAEHFVLPSLADRLASVGLVALVLGYSRSVRFPWAPSSCCAGRPTRPWTEWTATTAASDRC
jgi:hypothetical protein